MRYDWQFEDIPSKCACGDVFTVDHAMVCKKGGFIIQRHNELRDLEAELLGIVCKDVEYTAQFKEPISYYAGWKVKSMVFDNQIFLTLMKLCQTTPICT